MKNIINPAVSTAWLKIRISKTHGTNFSKSLNLIIALEDLVQRYQGRSIFGLFRNVIFQSHTNEFLENLWHIVYFGRLFRSLPPKPSKTLKSSQIGSKEGGRRVVPPTCFLCVSNFIFVNHNFPLTSCSGQSVAFLQTQAGKNGS